MALRYGDAREPLRSILGPEVGALLKPTWGLDAEGEIHGAWRDLGIPRVWYMTGNPFFLPWTGTTTKSEQVTLRYAGSIRSILPFVRSLILPRIALLY